MSPSPADNFQALGDNNLVIPPDTHGAVGPNHLMVMLNSQVRIQNKTGGTIGATVSLNAFWSTVSGLGGTFDPRVAYDPYGGRWIATACDDARLSTSGILIGVSQTNNPAGAWNLYKVTTPEPGIVWLDYPSLGFNKDWVVVNVNAFTVSSDTFDRTLIYVFDKANLYATGPTADHTLFRPRPITPPDGPDTGDGDTMVPAQTYDSTLSTLYLVQDGPLFFNQLSIHTITGPVGAETLTLFAGDVITPQGWEGFGPDAPQLGPPARSIDSGDTRMRNVVYRNGSLWTAQTVFLPFVRPTPNPNRASAQWAQILPDGSPNPPVLQFGRVDDPSASTFYAYPSIGVNANNDVLLGYSRFSTSQHPSANYSYRTANNPPDTLQPDLVFKAGEGPYEKDFAMGTGVNRWGDYSNTVVDPANDRDLWTIQEYAATPVGLPPDSGRWGTWWAKVESTPTIFIDDVSQAEGSTTTVFNFTVTLDRQVLQTVTVDFATANGSALVLDGDYVAASGQVTFNPGETSMPVAVTVLGDPKFETDETFFVNLTNPQNADIADAQGLGTIQNDDPQSSISVNDVAVTEGNSGTTSAVFTVFLSNPSSQTVTVGFQTVGVTAFDPLDYAFATGVLTFNPGEISKPVPVIVNGDTTVEGDETFHLTLSTPTNATIADGIGVGTIVNDDSPPGGVQFFTVTSRPGQNLLEWVNPPSGYFGTLIRFNVSTPGMSNCTFPVSQTDGTGGFPLQGLPTPGAGGRDSLLHGPGLLPDTKYCYSAFVQQNAGGTLFSAGYPNSGRPFLPGQVKWAMHMGAFSMVPPGNDLGMVHAVGQDGSLHSLIKGDLALSGTWPTSPLVWKPQKMNGPSQGRPSGIPVVTPGATRTIFLSSQDGHLYAFNAQTGALAWVSDPLAPPTGLQAHPSGVFTVFGGTRDLVFVGTRDAAGSKFYALRLSDGKALAPGWVFDGGAFGKIGAINGQAAVDQVNKRVYFASRAFGPSPDNKTVWCVDLETGAGLWAQPYGNIDSATTLADGFLFLGVNDGTVRKVDTVAPNEGQQVWSFTIPGGEGPAKGYVVVDRLTGNVYFSTATKIWGLNPDASPRWGPTGDRTLTGASTPLFAPGDAFVYAGGADGHLHRFSESSGAEDVTPPFPVKLGDGSGPAGSPTYDIPAGYFYVTASGVVYAVQRP